MPEIVVKLPELEEELKKEVVKGIEILARAEVARALLLKKWNKLLSESGLTEKECIRLGRELKKGRFEKLKKMRLL
ncbi:MAG: hypothetical protein QXF82_07930 [Nitrososphaeria archaeon]